MICSIRLAKAIVSKAHEKGIAVDQIKLQKLAYYCQGYTLVLTGKPLFNGRIEAWEYGPVAPVIYQEFRCFGRNQIAPDMSFVNDLDDVFNKVIEFVLDTFGKLDSFALVHKTHSEDPWRNHYSPEVGHDSKEITSEELLAFFEKEVIAMQDSVFAKIMDSASQKLVELPASVKNEDDFYTWLKGNS
ncbi:DUF4065 domain-containing protein [Aeromonas media]|uniref:DUF4065 domain-containing protein n=1 Tax=Aeromonas media TaxID=651 RepID=A0AAW5RI17_AERME|nr:type II toxin-antitoxin system antitoxin SocA domain-containing protein [Aeromonas media]MCV3288375.1 DUF4065 domain-containing protein [Aeromonas media]